ncbi:MAG TPA: hypothetical protein VN922_24815, partial [Bacteroidia bacterium]|nr:hypothetical protein [Bacteroidia bacterium]
TTVLGLAVKIKNIFFTSDLHFCHSNIIKYCNRPFDNVDEMNEGLISNYNDIVKPWDTVYYLGDISFAKNFERVTEHIGQLNGEKILIYGNHDHLFRKDYPKLFNSCWDYYELRENKQLYVLSHYPFFSWNKAYHGSFHFHGHCHGSIDNENVGRNRYDVGVDSNNYHPVSLEEIVAKIDALKKHKELLDGNSDTEVA